MISLTRFPFNIDLHLHRLWPCTIFEAHQLHNSRVLSSAFFATNMSFTVLPSGCGVCGRQKDLSRCAACKVMPYCSREHQLNHRPLHKSACNVIKKCRATMDHEEQILRNSPGDIMLPRDPFTNAVGRFWGLYPTRDYMRARFAVVEEMGRIHNVEAVEARFDHLMDMLRLCRSDNMGTRSLVPSLMLRLNKDQECYDFIKWWAVPKSSYDWSNPDLPYLDVKGADAFEPVKCIDGEFSDLSHFISATLLKVKLLLDLLKLQQSTASLGPKVPQEILDLIQTSVPQSPIIKGSRELMGGEEANRLATIEKLKEQINQLYGIVDKGNKHFWPHLLNPGPYLNERPESYSMGSVEESVLTLHYTHAAWAETPGAIDFINAKTTGKI